MISGLTPTEHRSLSNPTTPTGGELTASGPRLGIAEVGPNAYRRSSAM
jgi:hypothetical protein